MKTTTTARPARKAAKAVAKPVAKPAGERLADELAAAMTRAFDMSEEDAAEVAAIVAERFADRAEVSDEGLPADLRSLFYTLESRRLMSFRREEYENEEGQKRRAFYWRLRAEVVQELAAPERQPQNEDIYHSLPAECWSRAPREQVEA